MPERKIDRAGLSRRTRRTLHQRQLTQPVPPASSQGSGTETDQLAHPSPHAQHLAEGRRRFSTDCAVAARPLRCPNNTRNLHARLSERATGGSVGGGENLVPNGPKSGLGLSEIRTDLQ